MVVVQRKDLGLDNLEHRIKASYYADKANERGFRSEFWKATALILNSKNFLTQREYGEIFRSIRFSGRRDKPEMIVSYLQDLFSMGSFKRNTVNLPLERLDKVLKDNGEDAEALVSKAWIQMLSSDDENLKKVLESEPDWPLPYFLPGLFHKTRGEIERAGKWFRLTLQKNREHPRALAELGELDFLSKKYESAEESLKQALSR